MNRADERWVLTATILASSMAFIDGTALNVALPALQASLHASGTQLLWVLNGYLLMLAALILVGGSLGDRWGRKKIFILGISLFSLASLACGLAPSIGWLIAARIFEGIGGALMIPGSLAILNASLPQERRGRAIGTWSAVTTLVTVIGPVLGGFLSDRGLWRGVFLINLPIGAMALMVLAQKISESRDESRTGRIDWPGAALITVGLAGLAYGFIAASDTGFGHPNVYGALILGALALIAFILVEANVAFPMVPLHLFKSRTFSGTNLLTLFLYGALSVGMFFLSLNLVQVQGYSKTEAGLATLPFALLLTVMSRWSGGLVTRVGPRLPLIAGPAFAGLGFFTLAIPGLSGGASAYWTTFFPGVVLFGIGMGLTVAPLTTSVMNSVPTRFSGTASGINNAVSRTAGVLTIAIVGSLALVIFAGSILNQTSGMDLPSQARSALRAQAQNLGGATVPPQIDPAQAPAVGRAIQLAFVDAFRWVMWICTGLAWISALAAALLVEKRLPEKDPDA